MSQTIQKVGLFGVVAVAATLAVSMMAGRHHAAPIPQDGAPPVTMASASLGSGFGHLAVSPAVTYANLTIYPVYAQGSAPAGPAAPEFTTLAEGMDRGSVRATEGDCNCAPVRMDGVPAGTTVPDPSVTNAEQGAEHRDANLLMVTNVSPRPTYVPDGQVVPGGGQDRGAASDTVVPARSAQVGVAAFCVEHNRSTGQFAGFRKDVAIAIPSVRYAMQVVGEQQPVWNAVAVATRHFGAATETGTYAALIQSPSAQAAVLPYAEALTVPIQAATPGRVVGVVAAINGRVVCADLYRSPGLFNQLWPSLLRSYALQAAMTPAGAVRRPATDGATVTHWLNTLDSAPGVTSRTATLTQIARITSQGGSGTRTVAISAEGCPSHLSLLHEAFWTPAAVLTN